MVPEFLIPHEFAPLVQVFPWLLTQLGAQELFDGVEALHEPLHWIVPEFLIPHELAALVQLFP